VTGDLRTWRERGLGRLVLDRPWALNALTHAMIGELLEVLVAWRDDDGVTGVVIEGSGDKAFSAGGDIQGLWQHGKRGDHAFGRAFWRDEYRLDRVVARYPKPFVALMDGIVMGGGVGVSAHGSHRIVTERSVVAMPEVSIGFLPDVGGTWILSRAPGRLGEYLAMTATRLGPADAIDAGFADRFMPSGALRETVRRLETHGTSAVDCLARTPPAGVLGPNLDEINETFSEPDGPAIVARLERSSSPWAREAVGAIRRHSPLSVTCALEAVRAARRLADLESCLAMEFRFAWRATQQTDFLEGIRAAIIDRDRRPRWRHARLEEVSPAEVAALFAHLGDEELDLEGDATR